MENRVTCSVRREREAGRYMETTEAPHWQIPNGNCDSEEIQAAYSDL
jgi:hypothetical protein